MERNHLRGPVVKRVNELFSLKPKEGRLYYSELQKYWLGVGEVLKMERDACVRSFVISFLTMLFFPVSGNKVNYGLISAIKDVAAIKEKNWPRAILAQMYYGLDVGARKKEKVLRLKHFLLQVWTFEH